MPTCIKHIKIRKVFWAWDKKALYHIHLPLTAEKNGTSLLVVASYFHQLHNAGRARHIPHHFISPFHPPTCFSDRSIKQMYFFLQHLIIKSQVLCLFCNFKCYTAMVATNQRARLQTCMPFYLKLQILYCILLLQTSVKPSKLRKRERKGICLPSRHGRVSGLRHR